MSSMTIYLCCLNQKYPPYKGRVIPITSTCYFHLTLKYAYASVRHRLHEKNIFQTRDLLIPSNSLLNSIRYAIAGIDRLHPDPDRVLHVSLPLLLQIRQMRENHSPF